MEEPNYEEILKSKTDYYGETKAAYQFAAEKYARQYHKWIQSCQDNFSVQQKATKTKFIIVTISDQNFTYNNLPIDDSLFIDSNGMIKVSFEIHLVGSGDFSNFIENGILDEDALIHELVSGRMQMVGVGDRSVSNELSKIWSKSRCDNHQWKYRGERLDGRFVCEKCGRTK